MIVFRVISWLPIPAAWRFWVFAHLPAPVKRWAASRLAGWAGEER